MTRVSWRPDYPMLRRYGILMGFTAAGKPMVKWRNRIYVIERKDLTYELN